MDSQSETPREEWRRVVGEMEDLVDGWEGDSKQPSRDQEHKFNRLKRKADALQHKAELAEREERERNQRMQDMRGLTMGVGPEWERRAKYGSGARIGREALTYRPDGEHKFFQDLFRSESRGNVDLEARERLARHQREMAVELRDLSSTDGAGGELVPPRWLMDETIAVARAGRPFANAVNNKPLPQLTDSVLLPKILTGSATSAQADLGAVQETDPTTGSVTIPVKTIAGQVDVARQVIDRGQYADDVLFADLIADYNLRLDLQTLIGSGAGANMKGVRSDSNRIGVTYTDASPTVGELYSKIQDAAQQIATQRFLPADTVVMHPRRWGWVAAAQDTTGRPLIVPNASATNSPASVDYDQAVGPIATLAGLRVVVDSNLPINLGAGTNEDSVLVLRASDVWLLEDSPIKTRLDESSPAGTTNNLSVRLVVWNYAAFTTERYSKSVAEITGTGLIAPVF